MSFAFSWLDSTVPSSYGFICHSSIGISLVDYAKTPIAGFLGFNVGATLTLPDWVGVVIFSGLVVFGWNRAMRLPYTLDNAVDSALAVYLDWFNIFVRLLSLTGDRD